MGFAFSVGHGAVGGSRLRKTLLRHFGVSPGEIATAGRQFPITARVDIQSALEDLFKPRTGTKLLGILSPNQHEVPALANTLGGAYFPIDAGPLQHDEIDVGEAMPIRCLKNGLRLSRYKDLPFAIMMAPGGRFGLRTGVQVEIAVPAGDRGAQFSQEFFRDLELLVGQGRTYRGRIISLEGHIDPLGGGSMVKVHRLAQINRDSVILPDKTLEVLDHNVAAFMKATEHLKALQFQTRKGILFYGPPGTGKTYTIHYLASRFGASSDEGRSQRNALLGLSRRAPNTKAAATPEIRTGADGCPACGACIIDLALCEANEIGSQVTDVPMAKFVRER